MAEGHDRAARRIANMLGGDYDSKRSPDVISKDSWVEVKTYAAEIPRALYQLGLDQLGPGQLRRSAKKKYVALPAREHKDAYRQLECTGIGLMDWNGKVRIRPL